MKDWQCVSVIVCRQGRGFKKTHGAKWHCLALGGFGHRMREKQKDANCDVVKGNIQKKNIAGEYSKTSVAPTQVLTWSKWDGMSER